MNKTQLTSSSLTIALEAVASAATDQACAQAIVMAAASIQGAVLAGQEPKSFMEAIDSCVSHHASHLSAVIDRAVNFHITEDGGTLGLWMLPVTLSSAHTFASSVQLETESLNLLKMAGCLQQQFGFSGSSANHRGWAFVLPTLLSAERIREADIATLITLPGQARAVIRGLQKEVSFLASDEVPPALTVAGVSQFFLPVVAYHPAGAEITLPSASSKTVLRMTHWIESTLSSSITSNDYEVRVAPQPHPFSVALEVGERQRLDVKFRAMLAQICDQAKVHPNGMAALVAPYAVRQTDGHLTLGVTLVSRMTQAVVATIGIPVTSEDAQEEIATATYLLREMGMEHIQQHAAPIPTVACQHCGNLQYARPSQEAAFNGMATSTGSVH